MVKYVTMKRITQILASLLFVITVLTVYLAFDFAINNALSNRNSYHKRSFREHDHYHEHDHPSDDKKIIKKQPIVTPLLSHTTKSNRIINSNNERRIRDVNQPPKPPLRPKPGSFHKGKTGVKVNKPQKPAKDIRKRLTPTTSRFQNRDQHRSNVKRHV
jgi:hypothetical protein